MIIDLFRRCLLVVVFALMIGLLFIGGNKEKIEKVVAEKNSKDVKMVSNN